MQAVINGETEQGPFGTLEQLLRRRDLEPASVVLELNGKIVALEDYPRIELEDGDRLEIVQFVGGG